jgi:hypothetical protein
MRSVPFRARARHFNDHIPRARAVLVAFTKFWYNPKYKHIIEGLGAESLRTFYERGPTRILPGRDVHGNALSVIYAGRMDIEAIQFNKQVALGVYFLAWLLDNEWAQIHGVSYVETFEGFSLVSNTAAAAAEFVWTTGSDGGLLAALNDTHTLR